MHTNPLLTDILEQLPTIVTLTDTELRVTWAGGSGYDAAPVDPEAIVGRTLYELFGERAVDGVPLDAHLAALAGETVTYEAHTVAGRTYRTTVQPLRDRGALAGTVSVATDVTDIRSTHAQYRELVEGLPLVVYVLSDGRLSYVSPQIEELLGYPAERWLTTPTFMVDVIHEDDRERVVAQLGDAGATRTTTVVEYRVRAADGRVVWLRDRTRPLADSHLRQGFLVDVTAELTAIEALRESEARHRDLFDNANDMMYTADLEMTFTDVNNAFAEALGLSRADIVGRPVRELLTPESFARVADALAEKLSGAAERTQYEIDLIASDGRTIPADVSSRVIENDGRPVGVQGICRDLSGRRRSEEQLREAQKMETVGRLAGGLAHDFNNLLTAIGGYGELMARRLDHDEPARRDLEEIQKAAARASALTSQLLAFSRKQILQPQTLSPNDVVRELETMLRRLLGEDAVLEARLAPEAGYVHVDRGQLEQVLVNLVVNARDAMPGGGTVTIETRAAENDAGTSYVALSVADTGTGMDEATKARAFEPFFTTKPPGAGSGLGLSTVFGIVAQSGGQVDLQSAPGSGTRVTAWLPQSAPPKPVAAPRPGDRAAGSTILLLEDEEVVRQLVREILEHAGYDVVEARTPAEALDLGAAAAPRIDVLLTDVVMPGMSGPQVASALTRNNRELRVLYMSGYTDEAVVRHGADDGRTAFLQKPFTSAELTSKVQDVLDSPLAHAQP
jgi:two-component system cell cycle sensor histidine kinase/response regulator CckA